MSFESRDGNCGDIHLKTFLDSIWTNKNNAQGFLYWPLLTHHCLFGNNTAFEEYHTQFFSMITDEFMTNKLTEYCFEEYLIFNPWRQNTTFVEKKNSIFNEHFLYERKICCVKMYLVKEAHGMQSVEWIGVNYVLVWNFS